MLFGVRFGDIRVTVQEEIKATRSISNGLARIVFLLLFLNPDHMAIVALRDEPYEPHV